MKKSSYEFEVIVHGSSVKEYYHKGSHYIEGKEGTKFSLKMRNNSSDRVLFVPTVDGLSIMNGKEASFKSSGYIVDGNDSLTISGWRTSDNNVAEFFFSTPKESYATKMDKGGNLGVIGCAVFKEKVKEKITIIEKTIIEHIPYPTPCDKPHWSHKDPWMFPFSISNDSIKMFNSAGSGSIDINLANLNTSAGLVNSLSEKNNTVKQSLGTGFGEDKYSPVTKVEFEKESSPVEVFSIFYDTRSNLEKRGVEFRKPVYVAPSAFPNEDGYCERPR